MNSKVIVSREQAQFSKTSQVRLRLYPLAIGKNKMTELPLAAGATIQGIVFESGAKHTCTRAGCSERNDRLYVAVLETAVQSKYTFQYAFMTLFEGDIFDSLQQADPSRKNSFFGVEKPLGFFNSGGRFGAVYCNKSPDQR